MTDIERLRNDIKTVRGTAEKGYRSGVFLLGNYPVAQVIASMEIALAIREVGAEIVGEIAAFREQLAVWQSYSIQVNMLEKIGGGR